MPITEALGVKWISQLTRQLGDLQRDRQKELDEVNHILGIDPAVLAPFYISPFCQDINPADLDEDDEDDAAQEPLRKWLNRFLGEPFKIHDGRQVTFVLADAGVGKTSLLAMLKLTDIGRFWPKTTRMKLLKLGPESLATLRMLERPADTILLLDSLDEDPTSYGRVEERIAEILTAVRPFRQTIVTCRTQFFPKEDPLERKGRIKLKGHSCKLKYLSPFNDEQVEEYLTYRFPNSAAEGFIRLLFGQDNIQKREARQVVGSMKSLRMRPMLLSRIEDLMQADVSEWNPYRTYKALVDAWLDREVAKPKAKDVTAGELLDACKTMAVRLQTSGRRKLPEAELNALIDESAISYRITGVEFGGRSLLNRDSVGAYRFAHFSIQEFLVVEQILSEPKETVRHLKQEHLTEEVVEFFSAWLLESMRIHLRSEASRYLAESGLKVWANLSGANLSEVDLSMTDLSRSDLSQAKLNGADLSRAKLSEADLRGVDLNGAKLREADLRGVDLSGAKLREADLRGVDLSGAKLREVNLSDAKGDSSTILPSGRARPHHWET